MDIAIGVAAVPKLSIYLPPSNGIKRVDFIIVVVVISEYVDKVTDYLPPASVSEGSSLLSGVVAILDFTIKFYDYYSSHGH